MLNKMLSPRRLMIMGAPVLLAVILTTVLMGCFGDFAPVAPGRDAAQGEEPRWLTYDVPDHPGVAKVILTASTTIDPGIGGLVSGIMVGSALEIFLSVPPQNSGSSGESVAISMSLNTPGILVFDLGPDGTQFDPSAKLVVKGARLNGNVVSLYWQDPITNQWIRVGPADVGSDGTITASISHFSRYGLVGYTDGLGDYTE
jgi:hypothetical protein